MARSGRLDLDIGLPIDRPFVETRTKLRPPSARLATQPSRQAPGMHLEVPCDTLGEFKQHAQEEESSHFCQTLPQAQEAGPGASSPSQPQPDHGRLHVPSQTLEKVENHLVKVEGDVMYAMQALRASITTPLSGQDALKFEAARAAQKAMVDNISGHISTFKLLHRELKEQVMNLHSVALQRTREAHSDVSRSASLLHTAKSAAQKGMGEITEQLQSAREVASREMRDLELEYLDAKQQHDKRLDNLRADYAAQTSKLKTSQKEELEKLRADTQQLLILQTQDATSQARVTKAALEKDVQASKAELQLIRRHKQQTILSLEAAARGAGWACTAHERAEQRADALQGALRRSRLREKNAQQELATLNRDFQAIQAEHMREMVLHARSGVSSAELRRAQQEAKAAQSSLEDTFGKLERTKEQNTQLRQQLTQLQQDITTFKRQLRSGRAGSNSIATSASQDTMYLRKQLVDANASIRGLKKDAIRLQQEVASAQKQRADAERNVQRISSTAGRLQQRLDLLKSAGATPAPPRSSQAANDRSDKAERSLPLADFKLSSAAAAASERASAALKAARWALALEKIGHMRQQRKWKKRMLVSAMRQWRYVAADAALGASRADLRFAQLSGVLSSSRSATSAVAAAGRYSPSRS